MSEQVVNGRYRPALEYLNGQSMASMLDLLEKVGFANGNYLLANLGAAAWLGPAALARLEAAIRTMGIRQTGTALPVLIPLVDAVGRAGLRQYSDQIAAVRNKVVPPAAGWAALVEQCFSLGTYGPLLEFTAANDAFRVLDFVADPDMNQALAGLNQERLRALIRNARVADKLDGERLRAALDRTWRSRFPDVEPPWPKAPSGGRDVAGMSPADKLVEAIQRSEKYAGDELAGKLAELLTPTAVGFMVGTVVLFAVLEAGTGGTAGLVLVGASALLVGPEVLRIVDDVNGFITGAVGAKDEADLDVAAQHFAAAAVAIGVDVLIAVLLHRPTKAVTPRIQAAARSAGEFLKDFSGRPPGGLEPALVTDGAGTPRFVKAPPERLAVMESRGGGNRGGGGVTAAEVSRFSDVLVRTGKRIDTVEGMLRRRRPELRTQFEGQARSMRRTYIELDNTFKDISPDNPSRSGGLNALSAVEEAMILERQAADMIGRIEAADKAGPNAGLPGAFDNNAFLARMKNLSPNDRVALVEQTAGELAGKRGWAYESRLSSLNNRSVYRNAATTDLYAVDTLHGTFERCASTGKHLEEVNFASERTEGPDTTGQHDLKLR